MGMTRTVSTVVVLCFLCYSAVPRIVGAMADTSRLRQQLAAQSVELNEARAQIQQLKYRARMQNVLSVEDPSLPGAFPVQRRNPTMAALNMSAALAALNPATRASAVAVTAPSAPDAATLAAASVITNPMCRDAWLEQARRSAPGADTPLPFAGGNLEQPGVLEAALQARAPAKELIFLSVGDTRDHRREIKDPALKTISVDFLLNLVANLKQLRIDHYIILTTEPLCRKLQERHCEYACVWTDLWHDHRGLAPWGLKAGDMFLMWAQQWRYICRAMELGYRVLRADTDVYLAEDPYPLLHGPLFSKYQMVVQHDVEGRAKPRCDAASHLPTDAAADDAADGGHHTTCGLRDRGQALLNIGLVYLRSRPGGGVFGVINGTWARFLRKLDDEPYRPPHLGGKVETQALIDQPFMREVVHSLAQPDARATPPKPPQQWSVVPCAAAPLYAEGHTCALRDPAACAAVERQRQKAAFLAQLVRPEPSRSPQAPPPLAERVALAPDWLFGRGCLTHVRRPVELLRRIEAHLTAETSCQAPPLQRGFSTPAPGPAGGLLVATHFVYSMALKRKRAFRSFGWDLADRRNPLYNGTAQTWPTGGESCWRRSDRAMLFGHTAFTDTPETKSVMCALPRGDGPDCTCCTGLPSLARTEAARSARLETTGGSPIYSGEALTKLEGCNDYQLYWD